MTGTGQIFSLIGVVERDMQIGNEEFTLRIELFRASAEPPRFRARIWSAEIFRIQSRFPEAEATGEPADPPSDELILVDYSHYLSRDYSDFQAADQDAAIRLISEDLDAFLARVGTSNPEMKH